MPWTIYSSADPSAPQLTGQAGSLVAVLDAVLVNGYGAKAAAGWSKAFTGTNKAAYRNGAGALARKYLRVSDAGAGVGTTKEALIRGFGAMTDVDTGTEPFPTAAQTTLAESSLVVRKSTTTDGTNRPWLIGADDRTMILFIQHGDYADQWDGTYFGEFYSYRPGDSNACAIIGRHLEATTPRGTAHFGRIINAPSGITNADWPTLSTEGCLGHFLSENQLGVASSMAFFTASGGGFHYGVTAGSTNPYGANREDDIGGPFPAPNPVDGALYVTPIAIVTYTGSSYAVHGRLRGLVGFAHNAAAFADGDVIEGAGELAAKSWRCVRKVYCAANSNGTTYHLSGNLYLETSQPDVST